jgi:YHS domain-containing protein
MKILKIMAILLAVVAVVSTAGCFEKAQLQEMKPEGFRASNNCGSINNICSEICTFSNAFRKGEYGFNVINVVDVVCKMKIDKRTAEFTSKYRGTMYYFCALSCKKEFDTNQKIHKFEITENELQAASEQVMSSITIVTDSTSSSVVM